MDYTYYYAHQSRLHTANLSSSNSCSLAREVMNDYHKGLIVAEIVCGLMAIVPNALLLQALWRVTVFPTNLRMILGYLCCIFLLYATVAIVRSTYLLVSPPCSYTLSLRDCRIFDLCTSNMVIPNLYFCLSALCIERMYATVRFRSYDRHSIPYMAVILIIISWGIMFSIYVNDVFTMSTEWYVPICEASFLPARSPYLMPGYLILECVTMAIAAFTYLYNRHVARHMVINRALYDLSSRFLVDQNQQVNLIVLPSIALHFVAHIPMVLLLIPVHSGWSLGAPNKAIVLRSTYVWRLMYAVADPFLAFCFNVHLRQQLEKGTIGRVLKRFGVNVSRARPNTDRVEAGTGAATHFDYLDKIWARTAVAVAGARVGDSSVGVAGNSKTGTTTATAVGKKAFC